MTGAKNLTRKILETHLASGNLTPGEEIDLSVDQILVEDATGSMTALQFEALGMERVQVPLAVMYVDHNVLQIDDKNMDEHRYLRTFSARHGVFYSRPGNGISHYVHLERFAKPGELLVGADSHSTMSGAVGTFAFGAGGLDVAVAMAGYGFTLECPKVVGVELRGRLPDWVQSKDIILELLRRYGVRGGLGRVFEFTGEGVTSLSVTERGTICNMITEMGATAAVFPSDERVREWLAAQEREDDYEPLRADEDAPYDEEEVVELSELEPLIAKPSSPGNVVPVREVAGTKTVQVCVGSSVNSSYEDLAIVGSVLRESIVHPAIEMTVTPGSRQILDTIARSGVYGDLVSSGARMLEPVCGPCIGVGQAPSRGAPSVRTFNRNFPGRSGTQGDEVYLCSPATAAATALNGEISDPRELGEPPVLEPARTNPAMDDRQILAPLPPEEAREIEIVRGPNIVPPPEGEPLPETLEGRVVIVVEDDVSTGDMAPDGALGMSLWSNIPECAKHMFRRQDPGFHDRALEWGGGFVVGGHNYGQGSSREHAALSPLHLGIRAVAAKSFARIHRLNLIAQGILPLVFADEEDYERVRQGDTWHMADVRETIAAGGEDLVAGSEAGEEIPLKVRLFPREREILLAGGKRGYLRDGRNAGDSRPS
ncbi:aconitate hydratase [Rubrobacter marinus]|uniref:Aconitate hydratase n=1 Tax=Rubrobacter marinus TaxID=2653852 RepID=A0A6G8PVD8_9ACTN|nr:aconitate hydratase [Rubrobacter marinus]QIN78168.1 aconitate hydratase [Rubrobacter marinus]